MIQLHSDCLVFRTADGKVPCSAEDVAVELISETSLPIDPEIIRDAAAGVLHYFREEQGREIVTVDEFARALAKVLRGFGFEVRTAEEEPVGEGVVESDLEQLVNESGDGFELSFYPRLRQELQEKLGHSPRVVRFNRLRPCVKSLIGARRWSGRCERLSDQIVDYVRSCIEEASESKPCSIVIR